jgi:hypothetical protein
LWWHWVKCHTQNWKHGTGIFDAALAHSVVVGQPPPLLPQHIHFWEGCSMVDCSCSLLNVIAAEREALLAPAYDNTNSVDEKQAFHF